MAITREQMLEQSVMDWLRANVYNDVPEAEVKLYDAFDYKQFRDSPLDKEYVTLGFNFDDGGRPLELGSSLRRRVHTLEVWVFATTPDRGRNISANVVKALEEAQGRIPLKDYEQSGDPVIDYLVVDDPGPRNSRQPHPNPEPWQENAWSVVVKVADEYFA